MANPRFHQEHREIVEALCRCVRESMSRRGLDYPASRSDLESVFREILNRFEVTRLHDQREVWDLGEEQDGT